MEAFAKGFARGFQDMIRQQSRPLPLGPMDMIEAMRVGPDAVARRRALLARILTHDSTVLDDSDPVIVDRRNRVAVTKLKSVLADPRYQSARKLAIFYGVGHMPGLEKILVEEMDFARVDDLQPRWREAFSYPAVRNPPAPAAAPAGRRAN
jgi:hypothetical protein